MLGSLDCMHWCWKNCPAAWKGQFQGKEKVSHLFWLPLNLFFDHFFLGQEATVVLEAVVSQDLWFWHSFFGIPGANNDINILDVSPLFTNLLNGIAPKCNFTINGNHYTQGDYLADGIYPDYSALVKKISQPEGLDCKLKYSIPQ